MVIYGISNNAIWKGMTIGYRVENPGTGNL